MSAKSDTKPAKRGTQKSAESGEDPGSLNEPDALPPEETIDLSEFRKELAAGIEAGNEGAAELARALDEHTQVMLQSVLTEGAFAKMFEAVLRQLVPDENALTERIRARLSKHGELPEHDRDVSITRGQLGRLNSAFRGVSLLTGQVNELQSLVNDLVRNRLDHSDMKKALFGEGESRGLIRGFNNIVALVKGGKYTHPDGTIEQQEGVIIKIANLTKHTSDLEGRLQRQEAITTAWIEQWGNPLPADEETGDGTEEKSEETATAT